MSKTILLTVLLSLCTAIVAEDKIEFFDKEKDIVVTNIDKVYENGQGEEVWLSRIQTGTKSRISLNHPYQYGYKIDEDFQVSGLSLSKDLIDRFRFSNSQMTIQSEEVSPAKKVKTQSCSFYNEAGELDQFNKVVFSLTQLDRTLSEGEQVFFSAVSRKLKSNNIHGYVFHAITSSIALYHPSTKEYHLHYSLKLDQDEDFKTYTLVIDENHHASLGELKGECN